MTAHPIPTGARRCAYRRDCPYRAADRTCDQPRVNKSNGDAACHRMRNRDLLALLTEVCASEEGADAAPRVVSHA